ncbi:MAG: transcription termination factor NusA [Bacteroidota bacterium]|nr:transcription termination factor NusA [Candidatus Kapabacteria bacterium]MDW8219469.1 transcription termination factor NusA [Bacteroidota bacterium]
MPRKAKPKLDKSVIVEAFTEMARERGIDRETLQGIVKDTLSMLVRKKYGDRAVFDIVVNMDKGDIEIYRILTVVDSVKDPVLEISQHEANQGTDYYEVGDEFLEEITLDNIAENFGRRLVNTAGQTLNQRIRDVERENISTYFSERIGEIIVGEVHHIRRSDVFIMHNNVEMRLPREEQIPRERYRKGEPIRAIIKEVRKQGVAGGGPDIIVSRADNAFLAKLFEIEIPEIYDRLIEIKAIAREPGERAKIAVQSYDDRIDPVGACVGMKGIRIHAIVRELSNENIDVINYSDDPATFIARALSPAKVKSIQVSPETRSCTVLVSDDQVSLAIGKNGQNVRLASRLTGYSISLVKEGIEDIELIEFRDELGKDLYMQIIEAEIDTAREFLNADPKRLLAIPGMTPEFLLEMRRIMLDEFDEPENPEIRDYILSLGSSMQPDKQPKTLDGSELLHTHSPVDIAAATIESPAHSSLSR